MRPPWLVKVSATFVLSVSLACLAPEPEPTYPPSAELCWAGDLNACQEFLDWIVE